MKNSDGSGHQLPSSPDQALPDQVGSDPLPPLLRQCLKDYSASGQPTASTAWKRGGRGDGTESRQGDFYRVVSSVLPSWTMDQPIALGRLGARVAKTLRDSESM
jgi:hypothetical protein